METRSQPFGAMKRFGVMGGSFNPIHVGHLSIARQILHVLNLERIVLMPAALPPHKLGDPHMAPSEDRLAMCRLAVQGLRGLEVSDYELTRSGVSYTIDTARALRDAYGTEAEIRFVIGSDSLAELSTWREIRELISIADFAIAEREACPQTEEIWMEIRATLGEDAEKKLRAGVVQITPVEMSSTEIRRRIQNHRDVTRCVPASVAEYIQAKGLYR